MTKPTFLESKSEVLCLPQVEATSNLIKHLLEFGFDLKKKKMCGLSPLFSIEGILSDSAISTLIHLI